MKLKEVLKWMLYIFLLVIAIQVILMFILGELRLVNQNSFTTRSMLSILAISVTSALPMLIRIRKKFASHRETIMINTAHFIVTLVAVLIAVNYFWILPYTYINVIIAVILSITYTIIQLIISKRASQLVEQLNKHLDAIHKDENATHID